jgi:hypothetical protein
MKAGVAVVSQCACVYDIHSLPSFIVPRLHDRHASEERVARDGLGDELVAAVRHGARNVVLVGAHHHHLQPPARRPRSSAPPKKRTETKNAPVHRHFRDAIEQVDAVVSAGHLDVDRHEPHVLAVLEHAPALLGRLGRQAAVPSRTEPLHQQQTCHNVVLDHQNGLATPRSRVCPLHRPSRF